jgi:Leucine-rich repeat (LRR) protein
LFVNNTNVRSISPVENMPSLKQLKIYNTKVKKRAVDQLQEKRLDLNIIYY